MSQAKDVLQALLGNVPTEELSLDEQRTVFEKIKQRLASAPDLRTELLSLYKVKGFSDFALSLMWVARQTERDPLMVSVSPEDTTLVFSSFRRAMGESAFLQAGTSGALRMPGDVTEDVGVTGPVGSGDARTFSVLLEQFVESVQGGDEQRTDLLESVVKECEAIAAGDFPYDYREFCSLLAESLNYVSGNQLLDDIRVLNIFANIPAAIAQWADTAPEGRAGLLAEEIGVLRDFKSHFE